MISSRGRYALRIMADMAEHDGGEPVSIREIAERQDISKKYLEIIIKELVKGGLVTGVSGKGGGYRLSRRPDEYTVGEILELMEGTLAPVACLADKDYDCPRAGICLTLPMWKEYDQMVHSFFHGKTLKDLMSQPASPQSSE